MGLTPSSRDAGFLWPSAGRSASATSLPTDIYNATSADDEGVGRAMSDKETCDAAAAARDFAGDD